MDMMTAKNQDLFVDQTTSLIRMLVNVNQQDIKFLIMEVVKEWVITIRIMATNGCHNMMPKLSVNQELGMICHLQDSHGVGKDQVLKVSVWIIIIISTGNSTRF